MEVLLELLFSILGDVLVGVVASVFDGRSPAQVRHAGRLLIFVVLGMCAGALSTRLLPLGLLTGETLRVAWLVLSPCIAAVTVYVVHGHFFPKLPRIWPVVHAATLALTVAVWRYVALN